MNSSLSASLLIATAALGACASVQTAPRPAWLGEVPDGATVRVTVEHNRPTLGRALGWSGGNPRVVTGAHDTIPVALGAKLELRLPDKAGHPWFGAITGWSVGVAISYGFCPPPKQNCGEEDPTPLLTTLLGAWAGSRVKTTQWVSIVDPRAVR
jgi:hypothetical protein